jgi:L-alanine-DL-glutamate epimerase-like enolase superfamily enzyme
MSRLRHLDGGPIATAQTLHLAASLPNFFIQQISWPAAEADRRMRNELVTQPSKRYAKDLRNCRADRARHRGERKSAGEV